MVFFNSSQLLHGYNNRTLSLMQSVFVFLTVFWLKPHTYTHGIPTIPFTLCSWACEKYGL